MSLDSLEWSHALVPWGYSGAAMWTMASQSRAWIELPVVDIGEKALLKYRLDEISKKFHAR